MTEKVALKGNGVGLRGRALGRLRMDRVFAGRVNRPRTGEVMVFLMMDWDILPEKSMV
jgi:hypothetical protein